MTQKILFITSNRFGDAVLSMGLLDHILAVYPDARVTVACGPLPAPLFEAYPALEKLIPFEKERHNRHWLRLWRKLVGTRWDIVIDLRNSAVSRLIPARRRFIHGPAIDRTVHKVRQNAAVLRLPATPAPCLWFTLGQQQKAAVLIPPGVPVLGIGPTSNWIGKTWPGERFIELIKILTAPDGVMPGARVAIFAAPGEEKDALPVLHSIPVEQRIDVIAKGDTGVAAAALARCALYIGHDSGLMHAAAAAGTPTIGLFGPGWPLLYGPYGDCTAYIATKHGVEELTAFAGYDPKTVGSLMTSLSVDDVVKGVEAFIKKHPGLSRDVLKA